MYQGSSSSSGSGSSSSGSVGQQQQQQQRQQSGQSGPSPQAAARSAEQQSGQSALVPLYDAASSWWTQTCRGDLQSEVARAVASAAGRYMHVLWPQVAHEPGLELTRALLEGPIGRGWASRVFFSDDGSTAIEVALKMAFRRYCADRGLLEGGGAPALEVSSGGRAAF